MFDVGSYRSAVNMLEDTDDSYPRPPSYATVTESHPKRKSRGATGTRYHSQQELDSDWVSVPINGRHQHVDANVQRSRHLDTGRRSAPSGAISHQRMGYRNSSRVAVDDGDDWMPSGRISSSSWQQNRNNGGTFYDAEPTRMNWSGDKYRESYPDQTYKSTTRSSSSNGMARQSHGERTVGSQGLSGWKQPDRSSSTRVIYNGAVDASREARSGEVSKRRVPEERKFLNDVQKELEFQRQNWKDEIEKMSGNMLLGEPSSTMATKSSYVDTSGAEPRFKAFVDVSEFPPSSVTVNVDKLSSKIIVEAKQVSGVGTVAKTFTQKVQLPRFADETRLSARMNRDGILKVEVPLIYYFPQEEQAERKARSFVSGVHKNSDGSKTMEILVKPGQDVSIRELCVEVDDDKLVIFAEKSSSKDDSHRHVIKKYTLPENADVEGISSARTQDGCLSILVPIY